jgi:GNAT superfamily N-acetyltransferase
METVVEHADPARDAEKISALIGVCRDEKRTTLNAYTPEQEGVYLREMPEREAVYVAYVGGEFAGFAGVSQRWAYSDRMRHCGECGTWVMPKYRGRGVGRALWMDGILPWCRDQGFTHLGALVMAHNRGSIAFYERMGFHVCGYHRKVVDWDGELLDSVEIERLL